MTCDITRRSFALLTLGVFASGLPGLGYAQATAYQNPGILEEPEQLSARLQMVTTGQMSKPQGFTIVDVRSRDEYLAGHIPGAAYLDPNAVVAKHSPIDGTLLPVPEIDSLLSNTGISADKRIVFYDDKGGFHAARMLWLLEYLSHRNVAVLNGGWSAWRAIEGTSSKAKGSISKTVFQSAPSPRRLATAEDVLAHKSRADAVLIDVRPPHMYSEGHIPWAINVPWSQNLDGNKRYLPAKELKAHFESNGVTPEHDTIMHCQNGLASAHSYVALRLLGYPRVRVYHRSWAEWGSDPSLPKATA